MSIVEPLCGSCTLKKCSAKFLEPEKVDVLVIVDSPDLITVRGPKYCSMLTELRKIIKPLLEKYNKTAKLTFAVSCPTLDATGETRPFNMVEFASCHTRLRNEIIKCDPSTILLVGDFSALKDTSPEPFDDFMFRSGFMVHDIPTIVVPNIFRPSKSYRFDIYQLCVFGIEKAIRGPGIRFNSSSDFPYTLHNNMQTFMFDVYSQTKDKYMSIDIETIGPDKKGLNPKAHVISCLGVRIDGVNHILTMDAIYRPQHKGYLIQMLTDDKIKIGANLAYEDRSFKFHFGCHLTNPYDIQLTEYGAIREKGPYNLQFMARLYTDCKGWKDDVNYGIIDETLYRYLARDLVYTEDVYNAQSTIFGRAS